jgi:hypothetical protein
MAHRKGTADRMDDLTTLAERIAEDRAGAELFFSSLGVLGPPKGSAERARLERFAEVGAYTDCVLMLHRLALPSHGFELGRTHAGRAFAGSWRGGDAQIATTTAATPALALLRATATALARCERSRMRAACTLCNGRGWYVTAENGKQICRHNWMTS